MQKRLLIVTEAGDAWPSGIARALIYKNLFQSRNIHVDYMARRYPWLVRTLEGHGMGFLHRGVIGKALKIILAKMSGPIIHVQEKLIQRKVCERYNSIYLQKTGSFELVSAVRRLTDAKIVFDLNDAVWLPAHSSYADGKVREILKLVDAVTCDNPYGVAFARTYNVNTSLIPDPSQVEMFDLYRSTVVKPNNPLVIGWIGSPSATFNLFAIWEALEDIFSRNEDIILRLIGTGYNPHLPRFEKVRYDIIPYYSDSDMIHHVLGMNIGLFPLFDVEDSKGRGILKATIYMSGEAAVIASPRGQVPELIQDGVNGMLANSTAEWVSKLELLINDHAARRRIAAAGLITAHEFSLEKSFAGLLRALSLDKSF